MPHHPLHHRRVALLVAFVAIVLAVTTSDALHQAFVDVLAIAERLMRAYPRAGMLAFVGLASLSAMLSFFSSSALVPVGVYVWGAQQTMLMLWVGGVLGGTAGYWMARTLGRRIVKRLVPEAPFRRYETFFRARAQWRTVLLFRLALQSELPSYVLGVLRYPFRRYLPMMLLGEIPFVFFAVYLGETLLERNGVVFAVALLMGVGLTVLAFRALQREMRSDAPPIAR
ncbi:MAG: TVP38/TMEM64 family protein [Gemmatimonadetes bacterium]|nr:TVP38/TMEM64 family protein [Gemmatimonadota bacterium]